MIPLITIAVILLMVAAYSIGHYHGTQSCAEDVRLVSEALKCMRGGDKDEKKSL